MKIYITPLADKAGRYSVTLEAGELLVDSTRLPFYDGARALQARGLSGPFEMWDRVRPWARMRGDIATAAKLTVSETDKGMWIVPWMPFPGVAGGQK